MAEQCLNYRQSGQKTLFLKLSKFQEDQYKECLNYGLELVSCGEVSCEFSHDPGYSDFDFLKRHGSTFHLRKQATSKYTEGGHLHFLPDQGAACYHFHWRPPFEWETSRELEARLKAQAVVG